MNPGRVRSLFDVLRLHASSYMQIARICEEYTSSHQMMQANPNAYPTPEQWEIVRGNLESIRDICRHMGLRVSARSVERILAEFEIKIPNMGLSKQRFLEWYSCFQSEVDGEVYLLMLPHRAVYWSSEVDRLEGPEISSLLGSLKAFPQAFHDAKEAGNCLAFERFTASVYHSMRVGEFALVSLAQSVNVEQERINRGWDGCIQGIQSAISKLESQKPRPDWRDEVKALGSLNTWFQSMSKGWRNPVSHIPRTYTEDQATAIFMAVKTLFQEVNRRGIGQVSIPAVFPVD
jgi:hypothetical protein